MSTNTEEHSNLSPSEKAWDTAKRRAVEEDRARNSENSEKFYSQLDDEIRALTDRSLPHGAVRLFLLICKLSWQPQHGGRFKGRVGALGISGRILARKLGTNVKSFYSKKARVTAVVRPGWIELLVQGGYIWIGHHKLPNIKHDLSLNVYNVACLVPRVHQGSLPWMDGNWGGEVHIADDAAGQGGAVPRNGHGDCLAQNGEGNGESPEKGTSCPPERALPVPRNGHGPSPGTGTASPPERARAVPRNGHGLSPGTGTGCPPERARAVPRNGHGPSAGTGHISKTGDGYSGDQTAKTVNRLGNRSVEKPKKEVTGDENDFMLLCLEVFTKPVMNKGSEGGYWRTLFRQNPDKAWRVVREVREVKRTRPTEITGSPVRFAQHLWKQFA